MAAGQKKKPVKAPKKGQKTAPANLIEFPSLFSYPLVANLCNLALEPCHCPVLLGLNFRSAFHSF